MKGIETAAATCTWRPRMSDAFKRQFFISDDADRYQARRQPIKNVSVLLALLVRLLNV